MSEQRLLDTNLVIAFLERESEVVQRVLALDDVLMSVVVLGELQLGARASSRPDENLERIERMLKWTTIVPCNEQTSAQYGMIKHQLRAEGSMIPDNDIWIAASSRQVGVPLASRDQHFSNIKHLDWEVW